jgi:hypothetical protein
VFLQGREQTRPKNEGPGMARTDPDNVEDGSDAVRRHNPSLLSVDDDAVGRTDPVRLGRLVCVTQLEELETRGL